MLAKNDYDRGLAAHRQGRLDEAITAYRLAIAATPAFAEALNALGIALQQRGDLASAIAHYRAALEAKPDYASACGNLGAALFTQGEIAAALDYYRRAIDLRPDHADAHYNLGKALHEGGDAAGAIECYRRATTFEPGHVSAWNNLGIALRDLGHPDQAVVSYRRALALKPDAAEIRYNQAMALLEGGHFETGWGEYEARFAAGDVPERAFGRPRWTGQDLSGKTLLVWAEQGFGDSLLFARCLGMLAGRAARVVFETQPALARLMRSLPGADLVVAAGHPLPPFDFQVPLLSLPGLLGIRLASIPAQVPYLSAEPDLVETWRQRLDQTSNGRLRIGLAWAGNPNQKNNHNRSLPAAALAGLLALPTAFYSLQQGDEAERLNRSGIGQVIDLAPHLTDFAETAAALAGLDLIITVDTAVAHLAGALGCPTWTLLAFAPDWRWLRDRADSPWYPSMRLFRQDRPRDWTPVMARVVDALSTEITP